MPARLPSEDRPLAVSLQRAADAIRRAGALLITAGAGLGVDSGLPDFRGSEGFWRAYPPFRERGLSFVDLANPRWFTADPEQAWGFYGHRHHLYCETTPHKGFSILKRWAARAPGGYFVYTSNLDGHFEKSGFSDKRVLECHGSLAHLQCHARCCADIWPALDLTLDIDEATFRARPPLPRCPRCGSIARPNVLMFRDTQWLASRTEGQGQLYGEWLDAVSQQELVVIEIGAGEAVPTVRRESERRGGTLVRINPHDARVPAGGIALAMGGLEALVALDVLVDRQS